MARVRARTIGAAIAGALFGAVLTLSLQPAAPLTPVPPELGEDATPPRVGVDERVLETPKPTSIPQPAEQILLAWTPGGLPTGFGDAIGALPDVEAVTVVSGELLGLTLSTDSDGQVVDAPAGGGVIPLDVIAYDPATFAGFVPPSARAAIADLRGGGALLGTTSARLRRLGHGGTITLDSGDTLTIAAVVDDVLIGGAEVAVVMGPTSPVQTPRYVMLRYGGDRVSVEQNIRALALDTAVRVRGPGETPVFRHGDAVLPQAQIKDRFGEFSYLPGIGRDVTQEQTWRTQNIVTADVPLLGSVTCHRDLFPALRGAMTELAQRNLGALIDTSGFAGCYNGRLTNSKQSVSRHAWGIAVDINFNKNPEGSVGVQDPRLIEVMERWGFGWGGTWLIPDPAHFEYLGPPR